MVVAWLLAALPDPTAAQPANPSQKPSSADSEAQTGQTTPPTVVPPPANEKPPPAVAEPQTPGGPASAVPAQPTPRSQDSPPPPSPSDRRHSEWPYWVWVGGFVVAVVVVALVLLALWEIAINLLGRKPRIGDDRRRSNGYRNRAPETAERQPVREKAGTPNQRSIAAPDGSIACKLLTVSKRDSKDDENEDAFDGDVDTRRFAIADGVSQSSFAREWAQLIVTRFVGQPVAPEDLTEWLREPCEELPRRIDWQAIERKFKDSAWLVDEFRHGYAAATLVGLTLMPARNGGASWRAIAIGDSCLFQVSNDQLIRRFPIEHPENFKSTTWAVSSKIEDNEALPVHSTRGHVLPGDLLFLMTDALSEWFLIEAGQRRAPWHELWKMDQNSFAEFVARQRQDGKLRDDDTTAVMLSFADATKPVAERR
jgi:hypothetical protein